jgi:superfamily II DNA or RNA helicase
MTYFNDHRNLFELEPDGGDGLRECQLGAIWALKSHFTNFSNEVASMISMPTGSGKTALMMAACFELNVGKVLIVTPSKILRRQIHEQFKSLQILKELGCLNSEAPETKVFEIEKRATSRKEWENVLNENDILVSHPNSISPYYQNLAPIPKDLISTVIIDEAHHEPAVTWRAINDYYSDLKRIFLTATPFRRDRKRMRARLTYHYSIERALNSGIMRAVNFIGVDAGLQYYDDMLIQKAVDTFYKEREKNKNAAILIRTDRIEGATKLKELYVDSGLKVDVIHSKRSPNVNSQLVNRVKQNELDGLVCVGIASEGLDIPNLKIAVLHATPRSIPYTIQFLGRISRQPLNQYGNAILIANHDEVKGEVYKLYKSDETWDRLIPHVIDAQMRRARHYRSSQAKEGDFQMPELNVFFSALIYETDDDFTFNKDEELIAKSPFEILHIEQLSEEAPLVVITCWDKPIEWSCGSIYLEDLLDVHIYYYSSDSNLLFELTSSEIALKSFRKELIKSNLKRISHSRLYKTLSNCDQSNYIMVGMKNSVLRGTSQPSYKTVIGSSVQASVRASEGRVFSTGHALLRLDIDNTWGIATKRGRVWAMKRGTAEEFREWCDSLSRLIIEGPIITSLPGLSFLANTTPIDHIDELPIAIIPNDLFFRAYSTVIDIEGYDSIRNCVPNINPINIDNVTNNLNCEIKIGEFSCDLKMNLKEEIIWKVISQRKIIIRADKNENDIVQGTLEEILNDYPSSLIMKSGEVVEERNKIIPNRAMEYLPKEIWKIKDWTNCLITHERYQDNPIAGELSVINKTIELIDLEFDNGSDVLILDDGSHEIADLIWFKNSDKVVHFFHCKASSEDKPGCRKIDCDVLFTQAMRSIHWVSAMSLTDRLQERIHKKSKLINTLELTWTTLSDNYRINDWTFNIVLPQPGFRISQVSDKNRQNNNIYELAIPMYERILGSLASLEIWGS